MTWEAIWGEGSGGEEEEKEGDNKADGMEDHDEDGWGDELALPSSAPASVNGDVTDAVPLPPAANATPSSSTTHPSLALFLHTPLLHTALSLALSPHPTQSLPELTLLCTLHSPSLYPHRVRLVESIPEWVDPGEYRQLLPAVDSEEGRHEADWEDVQPWRAEPDWSESVPSLRPKRKNPAGGKEKKRSSEELLAWYAARVEHIAGLGLVAPALGMVQHAASRGVWGLDELGEELSLLSKLVYDRPTPPPAESGEDEDEEDQPDLTLPLYRSLSPSSVIQLSVSTSTPSNIAQTIRRLVLPYLSVLESRLERAGEQPDPELPRRLLNEFVLSLASSSSPRADGGRSRRRESAKKRLSRMEKILALFEASKPTLPAGSRIIKQDEDLARLALSCLYGFYATGDGGPPTVEEVVAMGKVLECLPAFDTSSSSSAATDSKVDLFSLSTSSPPPSASDLFSALLSASPSTLSALLDTLDLHLSQLESFLRYSCAPPSGLLWFLSSYHSPSEQRAWATRLARTAAQGGTAGRAGEFESEDEWVGLREFMGECTGVAGDEDGESEEVRREEKGLGRAFCRLEREEVTRVYFGGLLGAGRFSLARSLFSSSSSSSLHSSSPAPSSAGLEPAAIEELVISASRELYDNAEDGNLHRGEMKMAYECLSAAPTQTPQIRTERSFIEATSRLLSSYRLTSPKDPSLSLTPIELRHAPDRLVFIAHLLGTNPDAGRHPEVVLELVRKLGYPAGGKAEVRTLGMLAERATEAEEWALAAEMCDRTAAVVDKMRKRRGRSSAAANLSPAALEDQDAEAAAEYAWKAAFQLGKQEGWADREGRKNAVGQALVLCPPERIAALLPVWTELEREVAKEKVRRAREEAEGGGLKKAQGQGVDLHRAGAAVEAGAAKVANFLAAAASSATAGVSPSASPLSATFPSNPSRPDSAQQQHQHHHHTRDLASEAAEAASRTLRSAAAYLPSFAGSSGASRPQSASPSRSTPGGAVPGGWGFSPQKATFARPETPSSPSRASTPSSPPPTSAAPASAATTGPKSRRSKLGAKPLGAASTPSSSQSGSRPETPPSFASRQSPATPPAPSSPPSRFAAAFDFSPPTSANKFASAFDSLSSSPPSRSQHRQQPSRDATGGGFSGFGLRAGLSNKLTAGVGWLIVDARLVPNGPVSLTLALGTFDGVEALEELMEWEEVRVEEAVEAVRQLREMPSDGMQVDLPWELEGGRAAGGEGGTIVVVDTNVLISHLALLRDLVHLVASFPFPSLTLLIPHIVLLELDGLKNSSRSQNGAGRSQASISFLARAATNWLLSALKGEEGAHMVVRGQRKSETLLLEGKGRGGDNDSLVLDAALFFHEREKGARVVLLSDDNNLRLRANFEQVEATGVGAKADAQSLLAQLGTPLSHSPSTIPSSQPSSPPPTTSPTSPRKRRSPPPRLSSLPSVTRTSPLPLPSTAAASSSMELDPPTPPPLHAHLPIPLLVPVNNRADVYRNLATLLTHFIALPVFRHAFEHLKRTKPQEQRRWQEELGDWRLWEARDCVEACKTFWVEGDLEGLCKDGLEQAARKDTARSPPPPPPPPVVAPKRAHPPLPSIATPAKGRTTSSSRWATPSSTPSRQPLHPAPVSPPLLPPPIPAPPAPAPLSRAASRPIPTQLSSLYSSLPALSLALSHPPDQTIRWSAPRFEVLLEEAGKLLLAVLAGAMKEDVRTEVGRIVQGWVGDLHRVGVRVEVTL
ncbi:hypothetical protein JCM11251_002062 [Rhodosporidiobolus azoricus]